MTPGLMEAAKKWWGADGEPPIAYTDRHDGQDCPDPDAPHGRCQWCKRPRDNDPGDYYHEKSCEATHVRMLIAECGPGDEDRMLYLQARLEATQYVGD